MLKQVPTTKDVLQNVSLADFTTMKIGGTAKFFVKINSEKEAVGFYKLAKDKNLKIFPIGGGSNTIFSNGNHNFILFLMRNKGILKTYENSEIVNVEVQAGEDWDEFVCWAVKNEFIGLENLSGIPGTVGASPIQNIGAYGSEIKDTLTKVRALDLTSGEILEVSNDDCRFSYRNSIFKENLGNFIIISVTFCLNKVASGSTNNTSQEATGKLPIPQYKDVQLYFLNKKKKMASLLEIRQAILEIRNQKIPNPAEIPNSGSFFKNPIISNAEVTRIGLKYPEMSYFKIDSENSKLYAGWLIEKAGFKGFDFGNIVVDSKNALIITNPSGQADFKDLISSVNEIQGKVREHFGIELEIEPNIIQ